MALTPDNQDKIDRVIEQDPHVTIFLRPIAAPAALGLAGFAGSTWITASWIAGWWGNESSPTVFFPFVAFWGGLAQFLAGLQGYAARDVLVTVIHCMWGSFWMSTGTVYLLVTLKAIPAHNVHEHFPELGSWFVILTFFTWSGVLASAVRDLVLCLVLLNLAIGSTIACCLFAYGSSVERGMKAAAYFWIFSSILAWWRVTVYLVEEAYGKEGIVRFFPLFRTSLEKRKPLLAPGLGEPGVKRGMPGTL
ncbi:GPR1/FUN34/yaaH family-domain-containing protein [Tricladium varicosporioides]|nr:GPR1/FUN34/yaaH family-domain-containing protein [Hymenoscyphus varicosporioides]